MLIVSPGQAGDGPALPRLLAELRVARPGAGRPRTTPTRLRGDKAYSSRSTWARLRARGITAVIAEPADQAGHRNKRGSRGGWPVSYDTQDYKQRNACGELDRGPGPSTARARPLVLSQATVVLLTVSER